MGHTYSETRYDNYEDSVHNLTALSTTMFGHLFENEEKITIEGVLRATRNGEGEAIMVGTPHLCLCWMPCTDCTIGNLN